MVLDAVSITAAFLILMLISAKLQSVPNELKRDIN